MKTKSKNSRSMQLRAIYNTLYRLDFRAFVYMAFALLHPDEEFFPNWHIDAMCQAAIDTLERSENRRLICNVPPQALKSFVFSIALPAFLLGLRPANKIICVSYGEALAKFFSLECRRLMETPFYRQLFPNTHLNPRKTTEVELGTTVGGYRIATSTGGTLTGRGAHYLIMDDLIKAQDGESEAKRNEANDWFRRTAASRQVRLGRTAMFVVGQRLHEDDLPGQLITAGWPVLTIPAIATEDRSYRTGPMSVYHRPRGEILQPTRDTRADIENQRLTQGSRVFSAQYQQNPLPNEGNFIKASGLRYSDRVFEREEFNRVVISCDPAAKPGESNNFTAMIVFGITNKDIHVLEVRRGHWAVAGIANHISALAEEYDTDTVLIEDTAAGPAVIQYLNDETQLRPIACQPKGSKEERVLNNLGKIESGHLYLPKEAPWLLDFVREILGFPSCTYSDQVDALTQFLEWLRHNDYQDVSVGSFGAVPGGGQHTRFDHPGY